MNQKEIIELSDKLLSKLLIFKENNNDFTFSLRQRDSPQAKDVKRLENGQWFQGSNYIYVPLFNRGDNARKIKTIGFVIGNDNNKLTNYIEISFKSGNFSDTEKKFHKELADFFKINLNKENYGYYHFENVNNFLDENIEFYLNTFRNKALELLNKYKLIDKYVISETEFQKKLKRITTIKENIIFKKTPIQKNIINDENNMKTFSLNQILYGPPGTGKTYKLKNEYFSKYTLTENSISPEAYFEDVVSTLTWWQVIALALLEIGTSKVNDILENRWVSKKAVLSESKNVRATIWGTLQMHTLVDSKTVNSTQRQTPFIFDKTDDKKWQLFEIELKEQAPETYDILDSVNHFKPNPNKEIKHYVFTTFHQSFSYEDFIEGIKPVMEEGQENVTYKIENGVFKELCLRAQNDLNNRYAIFIDEINRGNVSQIFGELITLIEQDKRIGAKNEIKVKLPYSKKEFGIPMNVDVIGTMNTADRSVEALDTALRRRFSFVEMMPEYKELYNIQFDDFNLGEVLEIINQRIEALLDRDHTIGHSYFINILPNDTEALKEAFGNRIIPLLQEYFYHDYEKIALILGEEFIVCKEQNENKVQFAKWSGKNLDQPEITRVFNIRKLDDDFKILSAIKSLLNRE